MYNTQRIIQIHQPHQRRVRNLARHILRDFPSLFIDMIQRSTVHVLHAYTYITIGEECAVEGDNVG